MGCTIAHRIHAVQSQPGSGTHQRRFSEWWPLAELGKVNVDVDVMWRFHSVTVCFGDVVCYVTLTFCISYVL
jgi:hypothetical protein